MNDRIEKQIEIAAPVARVWKALTDPTEFGQWFRVKLDAPFTPGRTTRGNITYPGYEHLVFEAAVQKMEAPRFFSYTWHPYPSEPSVDYSKETPTLVEFTLTEKGRGTLLTVVESGFDRIPAHRRDEAFRMNEGGWAEQMRNISAHVTASK